MVTASLMLLAAAAIAEHDLTEATANKIMKQYADDANVVSDMLANERRRQAEVMRSRLAEQRFRRRKNLKKTHDDELKEAEVLKKQSVEAAELHEKQEGEYREVVAELSAKESELGAQWDREDAEEDANLAELTTDAALAEFALEPGARGLGPGLVPVLGPGSQQEHLAQ